MAFELRKYTAPDFTQEKFVKAPDCKMEAAPGDGLAPLDFHALSIFPEYFKVDGKWYLGEDSRMDAVPVWNGKGIDIVEPRRLKKGDLVLMCSDGLTNMVEDEEIIGYAENGSKEAALIKLILPIYKPELSFDDSVESIGKIADLLGIDGVSKVTDIYSAGKDIFKTSKKDPSFTRAASITGNIAEILGWDKVSEITDFIDTIDEQKGYFDEEVERQKILNDYPEKEE